MEHKCLMGEEFKRIHEDIKAGEDSTKEITKMVGEIKEGHAETKFNMRDIVKSQGIMEDISKKNQEKITKGFEEIENKRLEGIKKADDLRTAKDLGIKEKEKEDKARADALLTEKKHQSFQIKLIAITIIANTIFGILKVYGLLG